MLTDRQVKSLHTDQPQIEVYDGSIPGFGVRVTNKGRKSFFLFYRARRAVDADEGCGGSPSAPILTSALPMPASEPGRSSSRSAPAKTPTPAAPASTFTGNLLIVPGAPPLTPSSEPSYRMATSREPSASSPPVI
jgi:hypothetical protein